MVMTHVGPMVFGGERDQSLCDPHLYLLDCGQEFGVVRASLLPCLFPNFLMYRPIIALIHANHQRTRPKKAAAAPAGSVPTFSAQRHALGMEAGASDVKCQREGDTNAASSRKKPHPSSRRR